MSALALIVCLCVCVWGGLAANGGESDKVIFLTHSKIRVKILGIPQLILYPVCVCGCVCVEGKGGDDLPP